MKEIKVKTIFGAHQIYQEIVNYPPKNIKYLGIKNETAKGKYYEKKKIKEYLGRSLQLLKIPRMLPIKLGNFDIVHSSRGIIPITTKPWIMDIEHVHSFFSLNPNFLKKRIYKKFIEFVLSRKNCKAILCHCEATRQSFFHYLNCKKFKDKIKVLYPSSHLLPLKKEKHKKIRILSILSDFECKAGPQILKVFSNLEKKYPDIELWFKADVPLALKKKYNSKNIKYFPYHKNIIPREELLKQLYFKCDIFLYPTLADSFGYNLIDALVAKMPIIGSNLFAVPEVVENKKNGLIFELPEYSLKKEYKQAYPLNLIKKNEKKIIQRIEKNLEYLIRNKELIKKMGGESYKLIEKGRFSLNERNKILKKIYLEALNKK